MSNTSAVDTSIHAVSAWFIGNTSHASGDLPETTLRGDGATAPPPETSRSWREIGSGEQQFCPFADTNEHFGRIAQQPRTPAREPRRRGQRQVALVFNSFVGTAGSTRQKCRNGRESNRAARVTGKTSTSQRRLTAPTSGRRRRSFGVSAPGGRRAPSTAPCASCSAGAP